MTFHFITIRDTICNSHHAEPRKGNQTESNLAYPRAAMYTLFAAQIAGNLPMLAGC